MFVVKGALKIKNASKEVALTVTEVDRSKAPDGTEVIYYVAEAEVDRYDFGIKAWPGVIGKKLKVTIDVQANREK
jgi:polyisoprenoid-binding protein YceI